MTRKDNILFILFCLVYLGCLALPAAPQNMAAPLAASVGLVGWYAREHVAGCLLPAFLIAGALAAFVQSNAIMRWLGPKAPRPLAYGVASVSGSILAVCSCTVLPLFAGIWRAGAGLGPAVAFLYAGPAINLLAIVLTTRVLGVELGVARAIGAIVMSVFIGLAMAFFFREERPQTKMATPPTTEDGHATWGIALSFIAMLGILVFANWSQAPTESPLLNTVGELKWAISLGWTLVLGVALIFGMRADPKRILGWLGSIALTALIFPAQPSAAVGVGCLTLGLLLMHAPGAIGVWIEQSWGFAKQILPLLLAGVAVAGLLLGRPEQPGLLPTDWIGAWVGGEGLGANALASVAGAAMYFATLTEVPILESLLEHGMGRGPALALLLAGPALSLPNMLVIRSVIGTRKTLVYVSLVTLAAMLTGWIFGNLIV